MFKVKNPLFSVPSAIPNLEKNNQASPHIISMHNEANEELALTSQMDIMIPTPTTTTIEQRTVNQTATMTTIEQTTVN